MKKAVLKLIAMLGRIGSAVLSWKDRMRYLRVNVVPQDIPDAEISWTVSDGSASIQAGANAKEVLVQGQSGMVDLSISVLGATDERMHFKAKVIE